MGLGNFKLNRAVSGLALGAVVAASAGAAFAADKVRVVSRASTWDLVLVESGVAAKYDLDLEILEMRSGVEVAEALVGGSADIGSIGATPLTSLLSRSDALSVIGTAVSIDGGYAKVIVPAESAIKEIEDLKGKRIATRIGSGSYRALVAWCQKNGCSINDFEILNTPPNSILAAVESGSVDAGVWFAPITEIAVQKGVGKIVMDFKGANRGQSIWVVNNDYAEENADIVTRFMSAAIEAQNILVEDPDRAAELLETAMQRRGRDLTAEVLRPGLDDFDFTPKMDGQEISEVLGEVFDSLAAEGKLRGDKPEYMNFMNPRFFEEAAKTVQPAGS